MWHNVGVPLSKRSLCLFWCEAKQKAWTRDLRRDRKWEKKGVGKGTQREELAKGDAEGQSSTNSRRVQSAWDSPGVVRKTVKDELAFLVDCRSFAQIQTRDSLQMHRECSVTKLPFLHFELTQDHIIRLFFVLFLPLPRLYFLWP